MMRMQAHIDQNNLKVALRQGLWPRLLGKKYPTLRVHGRGKCMIKPNQNMVATAQLVIPPISTLKSKVRGVWWLPVGARLYNFYMWTGSWMATAPLSESNLSN